MNVLTIKQQIDDQVKKIEELKMTLVMYRFIIVFMLIVVSYDAIKEAYAGFYQEENQYFENFNLPKHPPTDFILAPNEISVPDGYLRVMDYDIDLFHPKPRWRDVLHSSSLDMTETDCLAHIVYFESRNQSIAGQELVAQVTMNRVNSRRWGNTVCEVMREPRQYEWTFDGRPDLPMDLDAYTKALAIAFRFVNTPYEIDHDEASNLYFFHSYSNTPLSWGSFASYLFTHEQHRFYTTL